MVGLKKNQKPPLNQIIANLLNKYRCKNEGFVPIIDKNVSYLIRSFDMDFC